MSRTWSTEGKVVFEFRDEQYELKVLGTFTESMEGQDADGNRGHLETSCDEIEILDVDPIPEDLEALKEDFYNNYDCEDIEWRDE